MKFIFNKADNSIATGECFGPLSEIVLQQALDDNDNKLFVVDLPDNCLDGIDQEYWDELFYNPDSNTVYKDPNNIQFHTTQGKEYLASELKRLALIPAGRRGDEFEVIEHYARRLLGNEMVDNVLADNILDDDEIQDMLKYLNA